MATRILHPLNEARDWTPILMAASWVHYHWATAGTPYISYLSHIHMTVALKVQSAVSFVFLLYLPTWGRSSPREAPGDLLWCSRLGIQCCHCSGSGSCCSVDLVPHPGTSICCRCGWKHQQKQNQTKQKRQEFEAQQRGQAKTADLEVIVWHGEKLTKQ